MSGDGPLRHVAAARQLGRFRSEADMAGPAADLVAVENDPRRTSGPLNDYARGDIRASPDCTNVGDNREMIRLQIAAAGDTKFHTLENDETMSE